MDGSRKLVEKAEIRTKQRLDIIYDGECSFCTRTATLLKKFDFLETMKFTALENVEEGSYSLSRSDLRARIHTWDPGSGSLEDGINSVVQIALRSPPLFPFAVLAFIFAHAGIGNRIYDFVAGRRHSIPGLRCDGESCGLPPER